jgi:hypothetical protein
MVHPRFQETYSSQYEEQRWWQHRGILDGSGASWIFSVQRVNDGGTITVGDAFNNTDVRMHTIPHNGKGGPYFIESLLQQRIEVDGYRRTWKPYTPLNDCARSVVRQSYTTQTSGKNKNLDAPLTNGSWLLPTCLLKKLEQRKYKWYGPLFRDVKP